MGNALLELIRTISSSARRKCGLFAPGSWAWRVFLLAFPTSLITACATPTSPAPLTTSVVGILPTAAPPGPTTEVSAIPTETSQPVATPTASPRLGNEGVIVFSARYDGFHETLYSIRPDGTGLRQLVDLPGAHHLDPAASPTGDRISFRSTMDEALDMYVLSLIDSSIVRVTFDMEVRDAASWSPDGTRIAFTALALDGELEIYILDLITMEITNLTHSPSGDMTPAWSPVEPVIVFASNRDGVDEHEIDLYQYDLATDEVTRLTNTPGPETDPAWSPDGSAIAFTCPSSNGFIVCVADPDGANQRTLMGPESSEGGADPYWSTDGKRIVFWSNRAPYLALYTMEADGSDVTALTDPTIDTPGSPVWIPGN